MSVLLKAGEVKREKLPRSVSEIMIRGWLACRKKYQYGTVHTYATTKIGQGDNPSSFVHESIVDTIALSNMILSYDTMEFPLHYKCANLDTQTTCNDESHYRLLLRSNSCKDSLHSYSYKKPDCIPILDLFHKLQSH